MKIPNVLENPFLFLLIPIGMMAYFPVEGIDLVGTNYGEVLLNKRNIG
jgi:hypothetical protein